MKRSERLQKLLSYSQEHKAAMVVAAVYSVINKVFDVFPKF